MYTLQELSDIAYCDSGSGSVKKLANILFDELRYDGELSPRLGKEDYIELILEVQAK